MWNTLYTEITSVPVGAGLLAVRRGGAALAFVGKLGLARFAVVDVLVVITLKSACKFAM